MSATIQFDADIYNAVFIGHVYFYDEPKKQYECSLRMLELFVRVENILPPYPRFVVMIVCFVIVNKLYDGACYLRDAWSYVLEICVKYSCEVNPAHVTISGLHKIELDILFAVEFNMMPMGRFFGDEVYVFKFSPPHTFRDSQNDSERDGRDALLDVPVTRVHKTSAFDEMIISCSTMREVQFFHHWSMYGHVKSVNRVMNPIVDDFMWGASLADEFTTLNETTSRFAEMLKRDHVLAQTASKYCMAWFKKRIALISIPELHAVCAAKPTMTDDEAWGGFRHCVRSMIATCEFALTYEKMFASDTLKKVRKIAKNAALVELDEIEAAAKCHASMTKPIITSIKPWFESQEESRAGRRLFALITSRVRAALSIIRKRRKILAPRPPPPSVTTSLVRQTAAWSPFATPTTPVGRPSDPAVPPVDPPLPSFPGPMLMDNPYADK